MPEQVAKELYYRVCVAGGDVGVWALIIFWPVIIVGVRGLIRVRKTKPSVGFAESVV
jgi:hypothetical protein